MKSRIRSKSNFILTLKLLALLACMVSVLEGKTQTWQQTYNTAIRSYADGDYNTTFNEAEKALGLAKSSNEKLYTLKLLSATCNETGNYSQGLEYSDQEIKLCKSVAVPDSVYINSLNTLVNNQLGLNQFGEALNNQRQLVAIAGKLYPEDGLRINQYRSDLGYSYLMTEEYDSAIFYLKEANKYLANLDGGVEDFLYNQLNIGQAYYQKGEFISALGTLQGLIGILEGNELDGYQVYAETQESQAQVQYSMENFPGSQKSFEAASNKYTALGYSPDDLKDLNDQLAVVYVKNGDNPKADSITNMYGAEASNQNLLINQISLAYSKYAGGDFVEAKQILLKVKTGLESEDLELQAEVEMLMARINLELLGSSPIIGIDKSITIFTEVDQPAKTGEAYLVKSKVLLADGKLEAALESLNESKRIVFSLTGEELLKYSVSIELLDLYIQSREVTKASTLYNEINKVQLLAGSPYESELPISYAILLQVAGFNLQAKAVLEKGIKESEYPDLLTYQRSLAKVYLDLGKVKEALNLYQSINGYYEAQKNVSSPEYADNLTNLGRVNVILGDFGKAEGFYSNSIKILEANSSSPASVFASTYNSYAIFQQTIGNFDKAKLYYSKAKFMANDDLNLQIDIIQNLATLSQHEGAYEDAIMLYKEALPAYGSLYGKNHPYYATALQNLANAYSKNGDPAKGIELIQEALEIDKNNGLGVSISYTNKLHNLAILLQETDELNRSKSILSTVLANRKSLLGENHPDYIYTLYNLAVLSQKMNDYASAKDYFRETIAKYDFQIESFFPYLSEQEKSKYYAKINEAFTAFQDFAAEYSSIEPSINSELLNFQLNHKAILLKSSKSLRKTIEQSNDAELLSLYDNWVELKTSLAKYYSMSQQELSLAEIDIDAVANNANELEKSISLKSELFNNSLPGEVTTWKTIQSKLKESEAAIELIRIKKNIRNDSIWYAALIVRNNSQDPELVVLNNGRDLENKFIKLYKNSIQLQRKDNFSFAAFWQPIHDHLDGISKIYLSSDGVYNKLNVSTLYDPNTDKYILDELIVHNLTNTIDLTVESNPMAITDQFSINLFGNPNFSATSDDDFSISELPGTRIEIETIDSIANLQDIESLMLEGQAASEDNIKMVSSPSILHIATHGFFLPDNTASDDMYSIESNPLMRSGLLLSGSQHSYQGDHINFKGNLDSEDGILTAYEAMNLDLSNSELVVLSACETGLGEIKNGEGVYGLQRSFIIAGAKSVLISLWKVDDVSTKELMILFYKNVLKGIDKFEALNLAQKELKEKHELPYFWGAFVLSGI